MLKTEIRIKGVTTLAAKCGRHKSTVSRVLSGKQAPGEELRMKLEAEGIRVPKLARSRG